MWPVMAYLSIGAFQADAVFVSGLQRCDEPSVGQGDPGRTVLFQWDRKAAAHAEILSLLADAVDDPLLAPLLSGGAGYVRELMLAVGRAADGMITSSRRRRLASLRAGDGEGAALEMGKHLRGLLYMWRLALPSSRAAVSEAVA